MKTPEDVARETLEQVRGPMLSNFKGDEHEEWQDTLSVLVDQEVEFVADLIRARDAEVRADAEQRIHALQLEMAEDKARRNAEIDRLGRLLNPPTEGETDDLRTV